MPTLNSQLLPVNHLKSSGCPRPSESGLALTEPAYLYYAKVQTVSRPAVYMTGITHCTVENRYTMGEHKHTSFVFPYTIHQGAFQTGSA